MRRGDDGSAVFSSTFSPAHKLQILGTEVS